MNLFCFQGILSVVSVTYIGCNVYRFFLVSNILELQRRTYNEDFVDVSFVTFWDEVGNVNDKNDRYFFPYILSQIRTTYLTNILNVSSVL